MAVVLDELTPPSTGRFYDAHDAAAIRLGRPLTAAEYRIDIVGAERDLEEGKRRIEAAIRNEMRDALQAAASGRVYKMGVTVELADALHWVFQRGRDHARAEMMRARTPPTRMYAEPPAVPPALLPVAARAQGLVRGVQFRVDAAATNTTGFDMGSAIVRRLGDTMAGPLDAASRLVSSGFNAGLDDVFAGHADLFSGWQYTAIMDGNTCDECSANDGEIYETLDEAYAVMPNFGPNPNCYGDGRCRCRLVPLSSSATEADVPDAGPSESFAADVGITPFRVDTDQAVGFYDSATFQQFTNDVYDTANDFGVTIDGFDRVTGIWEGEEEPSVALRVHDGEKGVRAFASNLGRAYRQDAALVFAPDASASDVIATFGYSTMSREDVYAAMKELNLPGGTWTPDGRLQIVGTGTDFVKSLDELSARMGNAGYDAIHGAASFIERTDGGYRQALRDFAGTRSITTLPLRQPGAGLASRPPLLPRIPSAEEVAREVEGLGPPPEEFAKKVEGEAGTALKPREIDPKLDPGLFDYLQPGGDARSVTTNDPLVAARALGAGKPVVLQQPGEIASLIDDVAKLAQDAAAKGADAPIYDLGRVSVKGTNLFTQQSLGIPRIDMPQLKGVPLPGSKADALVLRSVNPTGGVFGKYDPAARATAPLGRNLTTLDKTMGVDPNTSVTIYRGAPLSQRAIVPGDFVTTNKQLATDYGGSGHVIEMRVPASHVIDDSTEPLGEEYIYRPNAASDRGEVDLTQRFIDAEKAKGVGSKKEMELASHLRATQTQLDGKSVAGIMDFLKGGGKLEGRIVVSKDGYILDGHHRWAAEIGLNYRTGADAGMKIAVERLDENMLAPGGGGLLNDAVKFAEEWGMPSRAVGVAMPPPGGIEKVVLSSRLPPTLSPAKSADYLDRLHSLSRSLLTPMELNSDFIYVSPDGDVMIQSGLRKGVDLAKLPPLHFDDASTPGGDVRPFFAAAKNSGLDATYSDGIVKIPAKQVIQTVDGAIEKMPPTTESLTVYRGVGDASHVFGADGAKVGEAVTVPTFLSTTTNPEVASFFARNAEGMLPGEAIDPAMIELHLPPGTRGIWQNALMPGVDEMPELTLPRNTKIVVDSVEKRSLPALNDNFPAPAPARPGAEYIVAHIEPSLPQSAIDDLARARTDPNIVDLWTPPPPPARIQPTGFEPTPEKIALKTLPELPTQLDWQDALSSDERSAIRELVAGKHNDISAYMRTGLTPQGYLGDDAATVMGRVRAALQRPQAFTPIDLTLYRKMSEEAVASMFGIPPELVDDPTVWQHMVGQEIKDRAFLATALDSQDIGVAPYVVKIDTPAGSPAAWLDRLGIKGENEVLLPEERVVRVLDIGKEKGTVVIHVQLENTPIVAVPTISPYDPLIDEIIGDAQTVNSNTDFVSNLLRDYNGRVLSRPSMSRDEIAMELNRALRDNPLAAPSDLIQSFIARFVVQVPEEVEHTLMDGLKDAALSEEWVLAELPATDWLGVRALFTKENGILRFRIDINNTPVANEQDVVRVVRGASATSASNQDSQASQIYATLASYGGATVPTIAQAKTTKPAQLAKQLREPATARNVRYVTNTTGPPPPGGKIVGLVRVYVNARGRYTIERAVGGGGWLEANNDTVFAMLRDGQIVPRWLAAYAYTAMSTGATIG